MLQAARVLPSNAPPSLDGDIHQVSKVLQEQSGKHQQNEFPFEHDYGTKYPSPALNGNWSSYPSFHQVRSAPTLYHPQPQHRHAWRYGYARSSFQGVQPEEEARIQMDADRLYTRFRKSDAYIKYRNRQTKDNGKNGDQKWPDHLEAAFFRALVRYPPMGRRKQLHKNKQRGRNELIADAIEELTGEGRTRKQVSSHIQVLKPFVENDPYIMKWLAKDAIAFGERHHTSASYIGGRRSSNYPVTAPLSSTRSTLGLHTHETDPHGLQKVKHNLDVFEPIDFQMFVQRNLKHSDEHEEVQRLHTYTHAITNPLGPDLHVEDMQTIAQDYPLLAALKTQDCIVLDAEASLAFPMETWKGKDGSPLPGVELGIYFLCHSRHLPPTPPTTVLGNKGYQVIVRNTFYENGVAVKDHSGCSEARLELSDRGRVETRIKFGSTFWARTLGRLASRLLDRSKDNSEEVAAYIGTINATQEILACSEHGAERLLIIHWRFRQSTGANGRTSWRRLVLPSQIAHHTTSVRMERIDSLYSYSSETPDFNSLPPLSTHPTLASPFEYQSSSGSALSSATWPSFSDAGANSQASGITDFALDRSFNLTGSNINLGYDADLAFDGFDSSAYNFDAATANFAADEALQDYEQSWYDDGYGNPFNTEIQTVVHQTVGDGTDGFDDTSQAIELTDPATGYEDYTLQYGSNSYVGTSHEQAQAFEGAGQEIIKDEDALPALSDASFLASAMGR